MYGLLVDAVYTGRMVALASINPPKNTRLTAAFIVAPASTIVLMPDCTTLIVILKQSHFRSSLLSFFLLRLEFP